MSEHSFRPPVNVRRLLPIPQFNQYHPDPSPADNLVEELVPLSTAVSLA